MTKREIVRTVKCWSDSALEVGDFVQLQDGGSIDLAVKCTEAKADGVCTFAVSGSAICTIVDVYESKKKKGTS